MLMMGMMTTTHKGEGEGGPPTYMTATTAVCGDDDCELRGWLTPPG